MSCEIRTADRGKTASFGLGAENPSRDAKRTKTKAVSVLQNCLAIGNTYQMGAVLFHQFFGDAAYTHNRGRFAGKKTESGVCRRPIITVE